MSARGEGVLVAKVVAALVLALTLAACGGGKPPKPPESDEFTASPPEPPPAAAVEKEREGPIYPPPFSWEEIRAATKSGRTYRYRVEIPGKKTRERVLSFTKVDEGGAEIYTGSGEPKRIGWTTLQKHTEWPKDKVTTREETVKLPGGKFDCMVYEVRGDDGEMSTYFFARTLPGAPVLFYTEQDGKRTKTTTLLQHIQGKDSS